MRSKVFILGLLIALTFLLLLINVLIFLNKTEGYIYKLSNYVSLYYPKNNPSISSISQADKDTIIIIMNETNGNVNWEITVDDTNSYFVTSEYPKISLPYSEQNPVRKYRICNVMMGSCFTLEAERQITGSILILNTSIPFTNNKRYDFDEFCDISWIDENEKNEVKKILKDELMIDTCKSTIGKIRVLAYHINYVSRKNGDIGLKYWWNDYSAFELYLKALNGETSLTCNEYQQIYYLFANVAGIKTRRLGVVGFGDSDGMVKLSGHHFNESYIEEFQKWVYVDLSYEKLFVQNPNGVLLDAYEFYISIVFDNYNDLIAAVPFQDTIEYIPYKDLNSPEIYYFNENSVIQYKMGDDRFNFLSQLNRYLFNPEPVLGLNYSNSRLYFKILMQLALLISLGSAIVFLFRFRKSDK